MFLVMYESKRADLLYCLLLSHVHSDQGVSNSPALKKSILRLITTLLRTNRVSSRHKYRMHLAEVRYALVTERIQHIFFLIGNFVHLRYLGFLHLWFKRPPPPSTSVCEGRKSSVSDPISPTIEKPTQMPSIHSKDEILLILDQMLLFDDPSTFQGILGLVHHLQWANLEIKLEVSDTQMVHSLS